ncbi:MAG: CRISPR system precrRNA processing endoribonuclease RAMP protein Cas6 [Campylobacter sp.]|nr:CRISPR system precrRNA processing endoribonuclease RAMP protein Cas6 [Campylobacter sp.]
MRYSKITVKFNDSPPYFIGSQIRGALGYALKHAVCINRKFSCDECFASNECLYYDFYERKNSYHNYRLDFLLGKKSYDFSLYLFEKTCEKAPYIVSALYLMLNEYGLGKDRKKPKNFEMFLNEKSCINDGKITLPKALSQNITLPKAVTNVKLSLLTPLRIKSGNVFVRDEGLELANIINSIYARQMQILGNPARKFPYEIKGEICQKSLKFTELTRLSNRQKTKMNLGGITGQMSIKNLNKESFEVLKLGEIIGVGKQTTFGLGKIKVEDTNS